MTQSDVKKIQEEIDYRKLVVRKEAIEAVKEARAQGDLSENFEYKAAKQEKNRNESRIRYLENMIRTAVVVDDCSSADAVGLYDTVRVYLPDDDVYESYQIVTTMRQDALHGRISRESPVGKALLGRHIGDRIHIQVDASYGYDMEVCSIEKGQDDGSVPLNSY